MIATDMAGKVESRRWDWALWSRWVAGNAAGEALGLGGTALVGLALFGSLAEDTGLFAALSIAVAAVLAGTAIEGVAVGTAQWLVLRRPFPTLAWRVWAGATAAGAAIAWALGMLPSTLLSIGQEPGDTAAAEPSAAVVYALAFLMGLVLGPVLGCAQWLVLRRRVRSAGIWMPANALAWGVGMVLAFAAISAAADRGLGPDAIAIVVFGLAATGAAVGGIHGLALLWLLRQPHQTA